MKRLYSLTLGLFLLTVGAEKDFQGYHTEQTKATTVTKDLLLKKENTIGNGTEAIAKVNTHRHTAAAVTAKFPGVVLFDAGPTPPYERIQTTKALAVIASLSRGRFDSRNGQNSLTPTGDNPSAMRIHTELENEDTAFSSTQSEFESMLNGTSKLEVHLSADAVKASLWPHTLLDNGDERNTDSITPTSADGGPGVPILSASHPRVIDNLATLHNENDAKRSQGEDEKGISNLGGNEYALAMMQSIFQNDTQVDSVRGNTVTKVCLTCVIDRGASTEKSVAPPAPSPHPPLDSLSTEGLASQFNQFTTSLPSLRQQSVAEQKEMSKEVGQQNIIKHSGFGVGEQPVSPFNKSANHSQSMLDHSQTNFFHSNTGTVASDTRSLAEMSPGTQKDTTKQSYPSETERPSLTTTALYRSSKSLYTARKPVKNGEQKMFGEKVSIGDAQSKLIVSENGTNASHSLSTNFKIVFIQHQPIDFSSGSVSSVPFGAEGPQSSEKSGFLGGSDHSAASHPTAKTRLIEAHSTPPSLGGPTTSAVKHPESHSPDKQSPQTTEPVSTLRTKQSAVRSETTRRHLKGERDSHSFFKQPHVEPSAPANEPAMKEPPTPTTATREVVVPVKLFFAESSRDFDDAESTLKPTTLSSESSSGPLGTLSKITQEKIFDVGADYRVPPTQLSFTKYDRDLIKESPVVHNLKLGDKNEQVLAVVAGDDDKEIIMTEGKHSGEVRETKEMQDEGERGEDEKMESKTGREEGEGTTGEGGVTLRQDKGEARDEEGAGIKSETELNTENSTKVVAEKQRESLTEGEEEARREDTARKEDIDLNGEMGTEDVTNVPLGPTANSEELNRDKGHAVTSSSCCHGLIKQSGGGAENKGVHLGENIAQTVEMKNKPFADEVTSDHRPLDSTPRSRGPEPSGTTSLPRKPHAVIETHPSSHAATLAKHGRTSTPAEEGGEDRAVEAAFPASAATRAAPKLSRTFGVGPSELGGAPGPTTSPLSGATEPARPGLNTVANMLSLTTPRLAVTAGFLGAQPHFTVNSSTPSISIIHSISDHRHKLSTLANPLLRGTHENERAARAFEPGVEGPFTSGVIEGAHTSTSVNLAPPRQTRDDSSTRPPTAAALSSGARVSIGRLKPRPHRGQPAPQISQSSSSSSSSSDMTSGQPCSFKLSEPTARSDARHAPVDDNKQRSVQSLMASMSPEAKKDQFPLSSMSPPLNLVLFGGDSVPGTYSLTALTRSAAEKEIPRAGPDTGYANGGSGHAEASLGAADETNHTEEHDGVQTTVTSPVEPLDAAAKRMAEGDDDEKKSSPFTAQTAGRGKARTKSTDDVASSPKMQAERAAAKNDDEEHRDDLSSVDGGDGANGTAKTTPENNHVSPIEGDNEAGAEPPAFTTQATRRPERAVSDGLVPATRDFASPELDATGTGAFVKSDSLLRIPGTQPARVTNDAIPDVRHHAARTTLKEHDPSTTRGAVGDRPVLAPHIFRSDLKVNGISTQQMADHVTNAASAFQTTAAKNEDLASPAAGENMQNVPKKSPQAGRAEHVARPDGGGESLSLREPAATPATGKPIPAAKGRSTTETRGAGRPEERDISGRAMERSRPAPPGMTAAAPITQPARGVQAGSATRRAGGAHDRPRAEEYPSFKDIKTSQTTKTAFEASGSPHERTTAVRALDKAAQEKHALPDETSISQAMRGAVTDPAPSAGISPAEVITKNCRSTIGCAKSGEATQTTTGAGEVDHTAAEKVQETQAGNNGGDRFDATHAPDAKPGGGNCSAGRPVPGRAPPRAANQDDAALSPATGQPGHDRAATDKAVMETMTDETSPRTRRVPAESDRSGTPEQARVAGKTTATATATQRRSPTETPEAQEATATEVTSSEPGATAARRTMKYAERTLPAGKKSGTPSTGGAAEAEMFEAQNATRSARAAAEGGAAAKGSGRRLLLPESDSELQRPKHRRRTSPHLYLSGVTEVSDDLCGSGNYTAEMSLNLGRGVEPGDAVPALGNLRVVINLKTNNSRINLEVTSCCLSPTIQPDLTNSTCCLFSRLAAEPAGITLLPSALSTSASFSISLFQMINYSVAYLHCDLSVCLRNRSDCERQCLQQRSAFPLEAIVTNLRNRISFGPMLKEVRNSTFPEEIDPSELDLALVIVSLVAGSSVVTVTLLLVWLAYRRRAIWPLHAAAPPRACCGCLRRGGDLVLP